MSKYLSLFHAESVERTYLRSLLCYHTFHSGDNNEQCNGYENKREYVRKAVVLSKLVRKLIPAANAVPVGKIGVIITKSICDILFVAECLTIASKYQFVADTHFLGQDFLR